MQQFYMQNQPFLMEPMKTQCYDNNIKKQQER